MPGTTGKKCDAGHDMKPTWDVCPYCDSDEEGLASTRVQDLGETRMLGRPDGAPPLVGWLVALGGAHRGQVFPLRRGKAVIGRDAACEVRLIDDGISDTHARIVSETGGELPQHTLIDLDSTNGSFLNDAGRRVEREEIVDGDLIRLADTELLFKALPRAAVARLGG